MPVITRTDIESESSNKVNDFLCLYLKPIQKVRAYIILNLKYTYYVDSSL